MHVLKISSLYTYAYGCSDFFLVTTQQSERNYNAFQILSTISRLDSIVYKSAIHILTKLFKLATVMLWESCSELQTIKLSHSITVSNIASLANIVYNILYN